MVRAALLVGFAALCGPATAWADASPNAQTAKQDADKRADIVRLLHLTAAVSMGEHAAHQLLAHLQKSFPQVQEQIWQELRKQVNPDELVQRLLPVYDKHFSAAEIKELLRFYETPLGKKLTRSLPMLNQELLQIGQLWGGEFALRARQRLEAESRATVKK